MIIKMLLEGTPKPKVAKFSNLTVCSVFKPITYVCSCVSLYLEVAYSSALKKEETRFSVIFIAVPVYKNVTSQDTEIFTCAATGTVNISTCISLKRCGIVTKIFCQQFGRTKGQLNNFGCIKRSSQ